jgi:hypothetical protein
VRKEHQVTDSVSPLKESWTKFSWL